mgnify:CR=1 FL=1
MNEHFKASDDDLVNLTDIREAEEDVGRNRSDNPTMGDVINRRLSRRGFIGSAALGRQAVRRQPGLRSEEPDARSPAQAVRL